jgi:hypothetical protein
MTHSLPTWVLASGSNSFRISAESFSAQTVTIVVRRVRLVLLP